jgi:hypothetical protein
MAPARFAIGPATVGLSAAATLHGYDVFTVDGTGAVAGFSYAFDTDDLATAKLVVQAGNVPVGTNATGSLAAIAFGDDVLVAMPFGRPDPMGTSLIPLDMRLGSRGQPVTYNGAIGSVAALARNSTGAVVLATQPTLLKEVDLQEVTPLGDKLATAPQAQLTDGTSAMNDPTIMAVGAGFLVVWNSSNAVHAQLFDSQLVALTPAPVAFTQNGIEAPFAAYATMANRYLFAWHQKISMGSGDEIWVSLRDSGLNDLMTTRVAAQGIDPQIAAGASDFLVVWQDGKQASRLGATRVAMDGRVTPVSVPNTNGTAAAWDLVVHDGQPAVAWVEAGGTGPNLWLDPLCH